MSATPSVILLHGGDEYAIAAQIEKLLAALGDPSTAEMNIARFDGHASFNFDDLYTAVNAMPFLAARRLVVLRNPTAAFPGRTPKQAAPEAEPGTEIAPSANRKKFLEMLDHIPPTATLVLVEQEALKPDHWLLKWVKPAGEKAEVKAYFMPKHWEMSKWLENEARKQGGRLEPQAASLLAGMTGEDTRIAAQEITKLLTYANYARPVTAADVEQVSILSAQGDVFALVDALGKGEGQKAQAALHRLLENEESFSLWGMVIRQFRLLLQAREMLDERATVPEVQKALGLHEFVAGKICEQARRFSISTLESIYHKLLEIDEGAKTSQVPLDLALDTLVVELADGGWN